MMKQSSDWDQHGEKGQDREQSGNALWKAMRKTLDNLANNGIRVN